MAVEVVAEESVAEAGQRGIEDIFAEIMGGSADAESETVEQDEGDALQTALGDDSRASKQEKTLTQKDFDRAVSKRLASERRKYENDPVLALGRSLVEQHGGDVEKAREALLNSRAEELSKDPKAMAKAFLEQRTPARKAQEMDASALQAELQEIVPGAKTADDILAVYPDFIDDAREYGMKTALAMLKKSVSRAEKQPKKLPQPIRPTNSAQNGNIDVWAMDEKQFRELDKRMQRNR